MLALLAAAACLLGSVLTQLPPSYTLASTNTTLGVRYGSVDVYPGTTLAYKVPSTPPTLTTPSPLNGSYIAILVDTTSNLTARNPAKLLWFQQSLTFSPTTRIAASPPNITAQVPYLAPSAPNHAYLVLLYAEPAGFHIPADFPYNATFREGFNVSRVAVDFKSPLVSANWFVLGSNCTEGVVVPTGVVPSGVSPSGTGARVTAEAEVGVGRGMKGVVEKRKLRLRG